MAQKPLSEEVLKETVLAVAEHGSVRAASMALGIPRATLQHRYRRATDKGLLPKQNLTDVLPPGRKLGKVTYQQNARGEIVNVWPRILEDRGQIEAVAAEMAEGFTNDIPVAGKIRAPRRRLRSDLMTVIPMGDPHFGMFAWAEECGDAFDLEIARRDTCNAVRYLVEQAPNAERCVIANMGDFFHADNMKGVTAKSGNVLDLAGRMPEVVEVGQAALRTCIETAAARHKIVEVINVPGNHDELLGFVMSTFLSHHYRANPRIKVHNEKRWRFYVRHGKCLLGFTHGDKTRDNDLIPLMATERAEDWGETTYRRFFRGHDHVERVQEYPGGSVEHVRNLSPEDSYASSHGFLSGRDMHALTFHAEGGLLNRQICSIDLLRTLYPENEKKDPR